jgi:hypothetical protein
MSARDGQETKIDLDVGARLQSPTEMMCQKFSYIAVRIVGRIGFVF